MWQLYKISLSGFEYEFVPAENGEVEILFDNCASRLNIGELGNVPDAVVSAESIWAETGERVKDTVTILNEVDSPNYPASDGYKTFHIAWDSAGGVDNGYIILKC